jgi:hypothetical protein
MVVQALADLRRVGENLTPNGRLIDRQAPFSHELYDFAKAQREPQIPPEARHNHHAFATMLLWFFTPPNDHR